MHSTTRGEPDKSMGWGSETSPSPSKSKMSVGRLAVLPTLIAGEVDCKRRSPPIDAEIPVGGTSMMKRGLIGVVVLPSKLEIVKKEPTLVVSLIKL